MNEAAVIASNVRKSYSQKDVLKGVNLSLAQGEVVGLLGMNGAGKSTLIQSLLGLIDFDFGKISILGDDCYQLSDDVKERIGYVPQSFDEPNWLTIQQVFSLKSSFYTHWDDSKVDELMKRWQLNPKQKVGQLSPGQQQRVMIICAFAHDPDLLILDEPVSALDPAGRRDFLKEIIELAAEGDKTVLFSTHITADVERVASKVAILHEGVIKCFEELDELKEKVVSLTITESDTGLVSDHIPNAIAIDRQANRIKVVIDGIDQDWLDGIRASGAIVDIQPMNLEDIFLRLTQ